MRIRFSRIDAWLLLMTLIWGSNFTIVKAAMREIPEYAFGSLRFVIASGLFLIVIERRAGLRTSASRMTPNDWRLIALLAIVGHTIYQMLFLGGLRRTSVANSSLIFGCTPIAVSLVSSYVGHERVPLLRWVGAGLSFSGIYLVVAHASQYGATLLGDVLIAGALVAWTVYTIGSRVLLRRHSPLVVTGFTMIIGGSLYLPFGLRSLMQLQWTSISALAWVGLIYSAALAFVVAYLIWYTGVQRLGNSRTSLYSNLVPVVAMTVAAIWLAEPLTIRKLIGAVAVLGGLALTRIEAGSGSPPADNP
jgi:drug/metabolite transporter (DMT)-like permease